MEFENRSTFAKVIIKHRVAYFFGVTAIFSHSRAKNG